MSNKISSRGLARCIQDVQQDDSIVSNKISPRCPERCIQCVQQDVPKMSSKMSPRCPARQPPRCSIQWTSRFSDSPCFFLHFPGVGVLYEQYSLLRHINIVYISSGTCICIVYTTRGGRGGGAWYHPLFKQGVQGGVYIQYSFNKISIKMTSSKM